MSYILVREGGNIYPYSFAQHRQANPMISFPRDPDDTTLEAFGIFSVEGSPRPVDHPAYIITEGSPELINGVWTQVWNTEDAPLPSKQQLMEYAAVKRWNKEIGGIDVGGILISTDRDSQSMITGAYSYSQAHPEESIQFKASSGWVSLDATTLAAIATAVGIHVQACFALEKEVSQDIESSTITTYQQVDEAFS